PTEPIRANFGIELPRQCIDTSRQAPHVRESRSCENVARLERARTVMTQRDDVAMAGKLSQAPRQLSQRNQTRAGDVRDLRLTRLTHVHENELRPPRAFALQLQSSDLGPSPQSRPPSPTKPLVLDQ